MILSGWEAPSSKAEIGPSGGLKTAQSKKRNHEDRGGNAKLSEYHTKTTDGAGLLHFSLMSFLQRRD